MPTKFQNSLSINSMPSERTQAVETANALLTAARSDPAMSPTDHEACWVLLDNLLKRLPDNIVAMSYPAIANVSRSFLSTSQVRHSLKKLTAGGYFEVVRPSVREQEIGGWTLKYRMSFKWQSVKAADSGRLWSVK